MQAELEALQVENKRLQVIITALAEQNRQLIQQLNTLQTPPTHSSNLSHPKGWMQPNSSNHTNPNGWIQPNTSNPEYSNGWIQTNASNQEYPNGWIQTDASNQEHPNGWIQTNASNQEHPNGWIQTDASNQEHLNGWIQTDASNQEVKKEELHPNAVHFATSPKPLQINMELFKSILREAGVGITIVSLTSSAAILWFCVQQPVHSSAKLMALTEFSEGGVSKRLIALKKQQLLYRSGYQYYTLTPKAIALLKQALI